MHYSDFTVTSSDGRANSWMLAYCTVDVPLERLLLSSLRSHGGATIFGCTSFQGVFNPNGFSRGMHALAATKNDGIRAAPVLRTTGSARARSEARSAATAINRTLGGVPSCMLLHATPGFEERVLEGIEEAFSGSPPPVYGGSAADDAMKGDWRVFLDTNIVAEGFLLVGFSSPRPVLGSFVSGYTPTKTTGVVTATTGRVVTTIDNLPAAEVYNSWTNGSIRNQLGGGGVLHETVLQPVGRIVDKVRSMPRYLLSHPHQVMPGGGLLFFSEMKVGDELILMLGSESALVERTSQATARALGTSRTQNQLCGGILVFCGGCVSVLGEKAGEAAISFRQQILDAPFVGASTFGEAGCFSGPTLINRHGNLMCDTVLFEGNRAGLSASPASSKA
jgi:hypothetical protein